MISLLLSLAAVQQPPAGPIQAAAMAFTDCVKAKVVSVAPTLTPEAGADEVIKQCEVQRVALDQAFEGVIATAPPEFQAKGREQYKAGFAQGRQGIVDGIKTMREAKPK